MYENNIDRLRRAVAYDRNGDRIGNVGEVYLDDATGAPMWVTVNTGFFGMKTSFAPLEGSNLEGDDRLVLAHDKQVVKDAPQMDEDGHLDRAQEDELYRYYGVQSTVTGDRLRTRRWQDDAAVGGVAGGVAGGTAGGVFDRDADGRGPVGEVLDGPDSARSGHRGDVGQAAYEGGYDDRRLGDDRRGGVFDRDADGRGPVGEVLDGPDDRRFGDSGARDRGDLRGETYEGTYDDRGVGDDRRGGVFDRDADGRGPVGEVLDGPDDRRAGDRGYRDGDVLDERDLRDDRSRDDGPLFDRDRDGRGPIEEVVDGPDDPRNPRRS